MGRKLGQHFLTDPAILDRIVTALDPQPGDVVLEIGAGRGTLTRRLAPRVQWVVALEKDPELARDLVSGEGLPANVTVVEGDALELSWMPLLESRTQRFKVVGNIPYYITSPLIDKALTPPLPECIVFLVQQEVAERLAARPGGKTFGALTVGVQAVARVERLFGVRRRSFRPPPAVDSAVVRITPRADPLVSGDEAAAFRTFVQDLFSRRRKQIGGIVRSLAELEPDAAVSLLGGLGVDPTARPEALTPETTVALFRAMGRDR